MQIEKLCRGMIKGMTDAVKRKNGFYVFIRDNRCRSGCEQLKTELLSLTYTNIYGLSK